MLRVQTSFMGMLLLSSVVCVRVWHTQNDVFLRVSKQCRETDRLKRSGFYYCHCLPGHQSNVSGQSLRYKDLIIHTAGSLLPIPSKHWSDDDVVSLAKNGARWTAKTAARLWGGRSDGDIVSTSNNGLRLSSYKPAYIDHFIAVIQVIACVCFFLLIRRHLHDSLFGCEMVVIRWPLWHPLHVQRLVWLNVDF